MWFDADGGLEHGDEWDAKIRRQIKECVLFLPIISANTQAREEGYFRLEWDLAAERARTIASGVPFILPVVIDDTREPDALVPDRFRAVQWTRLPGGAVPPAVLQRFLKLWSHRAGVLKHAEGAAPASPPAVVANAGGAPAPPMSTPRLPAAAWIIAVVVIAALVSFVALRPKPEVGAGSRPTTAEKSSAPLSEARQLALRARALVDALDSTREDYRLAEELVGQAKARNATDAEVCAIEAQVHQRMFQRG